jgi:hypothetical protein
LGFENDGDFTADTSQKEKAEEWLARAWEGAGRRRLTGKYDLI